MTERIDDILEYWFGHGPDIAKWFGGHDEVDRHIHDEFGRDVQAARDGAHGAWSRSARGRLALIILLDQFSRNVYRGDPACYAHDATARRLTREGIDGGHADQLAPLERAFLYMPLMHSEDVADQDRCVALFEQLAAVAPADAADTFANFLKAAREHRDIVARFGRFPHRNPILGRASRPEELDYLDNGGFRG